MRTVRTLLLASLSTTALTIAPAHAQDGASDAGEIVVTARRQNERLIDVPASVTVLTADMIAKTGVQNAQNFVQLTPGVTIVTGTAEAGDTQINIRGINGARDAESSVALVVDGILKTNTAQLNEVHGTLRQIEILKGPQGALYGRNAAAGAIVVSTVKPGDTLSGAITASYAEQKTGDVRGYLAGPIGDGIGFVLSGNYRTTDGFYRNVFLNSNSVDDQQVWGVDGRIIADLGSATTLDLKARYAKLTGASINFNASFQLPNFAGVNPAFYEDVNAHRFNYYSNIRPTNDQRTIEASAKIEHDFGGVKLTAWTLYSDIKQSLTADGTSADFSRYIAPAAFGAPVNPTNTAVQNACFASTTARSGFPLTAPAFIAARPTAFIFDPAGGSTFGAYSPTTCDGTQLQTRNQKDISAEVRLASTGDGAFGWQLGAYYLNIDRETGISLGADLGLGVLRTLYNAPGSSNPTSLLFNDRFRTNVYAAFGSADYALSDTFKIGLALRYDIEARTVTNLVPNVTDPITGAKINPGLPLTGGIPGKDATFRQLQPKINISWRPNAGTNIYANWGVGFKAGGFNNFGSKATVDGSFNNGAIGTINTGVVINDNYRKERSSAFEAGIKGSILDGRITYDLAGYYTQVTDMQFFEFFVGSFGLLRVVSNIDRVDLKGAELNLNARLIDGWTVFGAFNVTDSEIKKNSSRPYTVGNKSPYTADYTINLGTQIVAPLASTTNVVMRADYRITGPTWFHTVQDDTRPTIFSGLLPISALALPGFVGDGRYDLARRKAFGVLNLRVGLEGDSWKLTAFANNFLDRRYLNEVIPAIEFGGSFISPGQRRVIGVEAGYKF
jgi:iron complex outermembrane recepter protein